VPTLVPSAATRPSLIVGEQLGHGLFMRDRPRAALGDPLPVFAEGGRSDGGLSWVSVGNGLGWVSSHGTKGIACYSHCPGTVPRGAPVLPYSLSAARAPALYWPVPALDAVQAEPKVGQPWRSAGPGRVWMVTGMTYGQGAPGRFRGLRSWSPERQKASPRFRISLPTCVGTAGFEPATP